MNDEYEELQKEKWCETEAHKRFLFKLLYAACVSVCLANRSLHRSVHLLLRLQYVPLGHWTPGIGQHVRPVTQPDARGSVANPALADGVVAAQLVVVVHGDHHLDFLVEPTEEEEEEEEERLRLNQHLRLSQQRPVNVWNIITHVVT